MMPGIALLKMPEDPASQRTYDQQLHDAAKRGKSLFRKSVLNVEGG
jgi:hypothetical protein